MLSKILTNYRLTVVSTGCFDVTACILSAFFIKELTALAKVTTKRQLDFLYFFPPFCINTDS